MKTIKFISIIAITFLIGLIYLIMTLENPLDQRYNEIVQKMMDEEAFVSEQEVLSQYPELKKLNVQIQNNKKMHYDIQQTTRSLIPLEGGQSLNLMNQLKQLKLMKEEVEIQMKKMKDKKGRFAIVD